MKMFRGSWVVDPTAGLYYFLHEQEGAGPESSSGGGPSVWEVMKGLICRRMVAFSRCSQRRKQTVGEGEGKRGTGGNYHSGQLPGSRTTEADSEVGKGINMVHRRGMQVVVLMLVVVQQREGRPGWCSALG